MSDFHPETWVPAWSVASILNGVLSFMLESTPTVGSVEKSTAERKALARASFAFNRKTPLFCELFPDLVQPASEGDEAAAEPEATDATASQPRTALPLFALGIAGLAAIAAVAAALHTL